MVDDEVGRHQRVDLRRIAAQVGHRVAHRGEVDDRGHAGEVLEDDPGRHERHLRLAVATGSPPGQELDVRRCDQVAAGMPEDVLEQDRERDRGVIKVEPIGQEASR